MESIPILPLPTKVSSGLWYTLANDDTSPNSSSNNAGVTVVRGSEIGGRIACTTALAAPGSVESNLQ